MRLTKLELLVYGPFRGLCLDFSAPGLHVVMGRNEAGKTTTLRAITGLLYGIDRQTPDAHLHKPGDLRIGGTVDTEAGLLVRVVRRKGNTNTLLNERGEPIDEATIRNLLGGVSEETFRHAFGLDHDSLERGARALLDGKGDLGESLFDASIGGGGEVQRLLAHLTGEAERIYKPRATALPLNDALRAFAEAQKTVRERQSLPEAFLTQEAALEECRRERGESVTRRNELSARRARLERAQKRAPLERRRERATERQKAFGSLAEQVARVAGLRDRFASYERTLEQRQKHVADAERIVERVALAARQAGVDPARLTVEDGQAGPGESLRLDARKDARVRTLLKERTALTERRKVAAEEMRRAERELVRLRPTPDGKRGDGRTQRLQVESRLASCVDAARALGHIEARIATSRARVERRQRELEGKVGALSWDAGPAPSLDAFVKLRLPPAASVERLESRAVDVDRAIARIDERVVDLENEAASLERHCASLMGDFAPPDTHALHEARGRRDEAWRLLLGAPEGASRRALEMDVERRLREADTVADRMIREADRVTTLARLRSESETNAKQLERVRQDKAEAVGDRARLDDELEALFAGARVRARGFAEMRQWLARHAQVADEHAAMREAEADVAEETRKADSVKAMLTAALDALESVATSAAAPSRYVAMSFGELVAAATQRLAEIDADRLAAEETAKGVLKVQRELEDRALSTERDTAELANVHEALSELLTPLGVAADSPVEEVSRSIDALRDLFDVVERRKEAEARVRLAEAELSAFEVDLRRAVSDLATELVSLAPRDAALALFARAIEAQETAQEIASIEATLAELGGEADELSNEIRTNPDPDFATRAREELDAELEEVEATISRLDQRIWAAQAGLEKIRAESNAAEGAANAQEALARVRENVERWARLKLAAVLLSREIERYREENQGPLLASSSALFSRLTLGAFAGIKAGFDDKDRPCLRCLRADGRTEVDVVGLSDGTRDQLYLSLRLASLLRRAEIAAPMPLVLDDVLVQLDDQRASAALGVLAEVAKRMQVLFFTHHVHLVELAKATVAPAELVVHELSSAGGQPEGAVSSPPV
jgi:uncharacterized protein YhaN